MEHIKLLMIIICFIECCTMSLDEIEDFANFLDKTSQLDQNLKKGTDSDDYDEDEIITDHAWEDSGKFEGDLILNERQRRLIVENVAEGLSRNGLKDGTKRWPNNEVIYYIQKEHFSLDQMQAIQNGIDDLARASCVKFRPYQRGDRDAVVIQGSRRGCFSQVGYQGGYQVLNLSGRHPVGRGCFRHGTVVHELLHSLGFYHMQSSPDRDDYVNIQWQNIRQQARHNFRKYNSFAVSDFGVGYDYDSVLHYSRRAFSANGQDTIVPKQSGVEIGQRVGLSDKDVQKLNRMYCDAESSNSEADEEPKKPEIKSRKVKNEPFGGHGIGYHQGKTVVIKLLPAAETYKLPDVPSFHLFDYFSKAPQAMSTSEIEGTRIGKEIIQPYQPSPPFNFVEYTKSLQSNTANSVQNNADEVQRNGKPDDNNIETTGNEVLNKESLQEKKERENVVRKPVTDQRTNQNTEELDENLSEAFEELSKVIKDHVYPSTSSDSNSYKVRNDYSFYTPPKFTKKANYEDYTNIGTVKVNKNKPMEYFNDDSTYYSSPPSFKEGLNDKVFEKMIKDPNAKHINTPIWKEMGSFYRTRFPFQRDYDKEDHLKPTELPGYISRDLFSDNSNDSMLYPAKTQTGMRLIRIKSDYTLFDDDVPYGGTRWEMV
ncbi:hypothetical protein K1T71_003206 [Dendrolimus kikuchii]|uniref:Uncharacterized protein n=1 Tax=Dendrolimus kikuchii TaxID=765133 RepID=A0ACC1DB62_9NEOP|nr:hypothetical protein K1T71_003206 [Dendrolimus kikuchii]